MDEVYCKIVKDLPKPKIYLKYITLEYRGPFHDMDIVREVGHELASLGIPGKLVAHVVTHRGELQGGLIKFPIGSLQYKSN